MRDDLVVHLQGKDAGYGGIDLRLGDLSAGNGLVEAVDHVLCIGQPTRAKEEICTGSDGEHGGLGKVIGITDAAHPEGVADNDAIEVELFAQYARHDIG